MKKVSTNQFAISAKYFSLVLIVLFSFGQAVAQISFDQIPENLVVSCDQEMPPVPEITAISNCGDVTIQYSASQQQGNCANSYTLSRTWLASDQCGNAEQISQAIEVQDNSTPIFIDFPENATVTCGQIPPVAHPMASDNCDAQPTVVYNGNENTLDGCTQTIQRSWTATDACGNSTTSTQTIIVQDNIAPVIQMGETEAEISCSSIDLQAALNGNLEEVSALFMSLGLIPIGVTDNCCITSWTEAGIEITEGNCPNLATFTCSFVAVDHCDNYSDTTFSTISVVDNTNPIITCPGDLQIICGNTIPEPFVGVEASDECSDATIFLFNQIISGEGCNLSYTRTYRAVDACGNFSECTQIITVIDEGSTLTIACPGDISIECGETLPEIGVGVEAASECEGIEIILLNEAITGNSCNLEYARTYRATDACGNSAECTQIITVNDNTAPLITCPGDLNLECTTEIPSLLDGITATDACTNPTITLFSEVISGQGCNVNYVRTYRATDACGNFSECTQTISPIDSTEPIISGDPEDITVECSDIPEAGVYTATDNCDENVIVVYSASILDGECENDYTILRRWIATDECGNTATVSQSVSVFDNTAPIIVCPANLELECTSDVPSPLEGIEATDNCSDVTLFLFSEIISGSGCELAYFRTYRAYDACGNFSECTQTITTNDVTPPVINGDPEDLTVSCDSVPEPLSFTATDNCTENVVVIFSESILDGDCESGYLILRRWIATDNCGNSVSVSQGIDVGGNPGIAPIDGSIINLSVAPNPTKGNTNFSFSVPYNSNVQLNITSPTGNELNQIFNRKVIANQTMQVGFNSEQYAAGIYFYTLVTDKEVKTGRLVVIK